MTYQAWLNLMTLLALVWAIALLVLVGRCSFYLKGLLSEIKAGNLRQTSKKSQ